MTVRSTCPLPPQGGFDPVSAPHLPFSLNAYQDVEGLGELPSGTTGKAQGGEMRARTTSEVNRSMPRSMEDLVAVINQVMIGNQGEN